MAAQGITTLISTSIDTFAYLTSTWTSAYPVVPTRRMFCVVTADAFFVVTSSADPAHLKMAGVEDVGVYVADQANPGDALLRELSSRKPDLNIAALELPDLDAGLYAQVTEGLSRGAGSVVDAWPTLMRTRMVKDRWEIHELKRMGLVMAEATRRAAAETRAGETEIDYIRRANDYAVMHEAVDGGVLVMGSGPRAGIHHTAAINRRMEPGDIVRVDLSRRGPLGYYGDIGRTLFVGDPTGVQLERFKVTAAGLTAIEKALVPGGRVGDAAVACKAVYEEAGFELAFPLCGHGMGLTLHEEPVIEPNCDVICVPDMMFAAEAVLKIGFDELRLVHSEQYHLESLVRVTESGPHVMASAGKEPVVISAG
jgi:Xaa-Pro aminopeptidase